MFVRALENKVFEALNSPNYLTVMKELESLGSGAIPLLEAIFNGEAKNKFGVPYRDLGQPLSRALIVARHIGAASKSLEKYLIIELKNKHPEAPAAIGALGSISNDGVKALINSLGDDILYSVEVAAALKRHDLLNHHLVVQAVSLFPVARKAVESVKNA